MSMDGRDHPSHIRRHAFHVTLENSTANVYSCIQPYTAVYMLPSNTSHPQPSHPTPSCTAPQFSPRTMFRTSMPKTTNAETINWGALQHAPGQYAFINIPEISSLQWHPFSIASSPLDGASTFMIKNMAPGSGQFTDALHQLAQKQRRRHGSADIKEPLVVNVDGPYGNTIFETTRYDTVVLVAGGIGITPLHGVLRFLHQLAVAGVGPVRRVHLVWSVRNPALFRSIEETLRAVVENSMGGRFGFALFATRSSANSAVGRSGGGGAMEQGLLDVAQEGGVESNQVRLGKQVVGPAGR